MSDVAGNEALVEKPLVTFALFSYNQKEYIREALEGAFAQTYDPLEILVFDDCSTDGTPELIEEVIRSSKSHRQVCFYKNDTNRGLTFQINRAMSVAKGRLIVVAAGDDISFKNRVEKIVDYWTATGKKSGSIFSSYKTIDGAGVIKDHPRKGKLRDISVHDRASAELRSISVGTLGCTQAWTKDFFDYFGPMDDAVIHEDITIPLRSLMLGSVVFLPDELVLYRITEDSQSRIGFSSVKERMNKMAKYWKGRVANYKQFDKDAELAMTDSILSRSDFDWINEVVASKKSVAYFCYKFFSSGPFDRIILVVNFSICVPILLRIKMAVLAFFPFLYCFKF